MRLLFEEPLKNVFNKTNKTVGILRKLSNLLPRQPLILIYKFVRSDLDFGNTPYDKLLITLPTQNWNLSNIIPV